MKYDFFLPSRHDLHIIHARPAHLALHLHGPGLRKAPPLHEKVADRRVVRDLLEIGGDALDCALVGLAWG